MENDGESDHEAELCKRNQQETRMFYLPIYNQKNGWNLFCMKVFGTSIQILLVVCVPPGIRRS